MGASLQISVDAKMGELEEVEVVEEVFENQRYMPLEGFSASYLLPGERPQWSDRDGEPVAVRFMDVHMG